MLSAGETLPWFFHPGIGAGTGRPNPPATRLASSGSM